MSIFAQHMTGREPNVENVNLDQSSQINDPLDTVVEPTDEFAQQRADRNAELGLESLTQKDEPVDGEDEDMKIGKTDSDVEVAEGEYGLEFTSEEDLAEDADLDTVEGEHADIERLDADMRMLDGSYVAVEAYGINPTAMGLLTTYGLLNGTALESMGLEDLGFSGPRDANTDLALESLGEKLKETAAAWGAKIMSFAKNAGGKIMDVLGAIWTKVSTTATALASASWEKAKEAGRTIKAHPVKSLLVAAAAVAAVAGVVALIGTGTPAIGAKLDVVKKFGESVVTKVRGIKWPFGGKITAEVASDGIPKVGFAAFDSTAKGIQAAQASKLGWSKAAVNSVLSTLNRSWSAVKDAWGALSGRLMKVASAGVAPVQNAAASLGNKATKLATKGLGEAANTAIKTAQSIKAGNVGGAAMGALRLSGMISLVSMAFKLTRTVVVGAMRMVLRTFGVLKAEAA